MNIILRILSAIGIFGSVALMFFYASIGMLFVMFFGTPNSFEPSRSSSFVTLNQNLSSLPIVAIAINPDVITLTIIGWTLTIVWVFFHSAGLSFKQISVELMTIFKKRATIRRRGSGYAILIAGLTIFVVGIVWAVLYWGGMLPLQTNVTTQFGLSIWPSAEYQFMVEVGIFWGFLMTIALALWVYNQSNRRDSPSV